MENLERKPNVSVVVVVYNMPREAPRTLHSLSAEYQRHIDADDYEVIVEKRVLDDIGCIRVANIHLEASAGYRIQLHGIDIKARIEPEMGEKLDQKRSSRPARPANNDVTPNHRPIIAANTGEVLDLALIVAAKSH